ncbi:SDR family NAD(P)-dependent oxidoreductase [Caminibacter profundus]
MKVLITGINRGIGYGLVRECLKRDYEIFAIGRSNPFDNINFYKCDLRAIENLQDAVRYFSTEFDLVILNAGILGEIKELKKWSVKELEDIFLVNVWSNKVLIDLLAPISRKIVAISSGAAKNGNAGWGGYSISKCALNMMVKIYAKEVDTKIYALAPGVIDTDMVQKVISGDREKFESLNRVDLSKLPIEIGVKKVVKAIDMLDSFPSGSFLDVRELIE